MKKSTTEKDWKIGSIIKWIFFGVLCTTLPPFFTTIYKIIVGRTVSYGDYLLDLLLVVIAVSANLISICLDDRRPSWIPLLFCTLMGVAIVFCWGFYAILVSTDMISEMPVENQRTLFWVAFGFVVFCLLVGVIIEAMGVEPQTKEIETQCTNKKNN